MKRHTDRVRTILAVTILTVMAAFSAHATPRIRIISPQSGAVIATNSTVKIRWLVRPKYSTRVRILLLQNARMIRTIVPNLSSPRSGKGRFAWHVPSDLPSGQDYIIKLTTRKRPRRRAQSQTFTIVNGNIPASVGTPTATATSVATGTSTPPPVTTSIPLPTVTPTPTATPSAVLATLDNRRYYTEHAFFYIPSPGEVDWDSPTSWDSLYSTTNINRFVNELKSAFAADYFFVAITSADLQPNRAPSVLTRRQIADGIGEDSIVGINTPNICRYHVDSPIINGVFGVLDHEIGHNWSVFIGNEVASHHWKSNSTVLGQMSEGYTDDGFSTLKRITGDPSTGFSWHSIDNLTNNETAIYSEQDLYLQGLSATFPDIYVLSDPVYNPNHTMSYSSAVKYDQAWVEARHGVRSPNYQNSEKRFRIGVVYVARDYAEILRAYQAVESSITHFADAESIDTDDYRFQVPFLVATSYRGSVDARLADLDGNHTPSLVITGAPHVASSQGIARIPFVANDSDGEPLTVQCVPLSDQCRIEGSEIIVSEVRSEPRFVTIRAEDARGKKVFAHVVVDQS